MIATQEVVIHVDTCPLCKWPDPTVSIKFLHLIRATWSAGDLRHLAKLADAAMLPRTPRL